jgi:DNA topoisomerase I
MVPSPPESAKVAGLRYVSDSGPGIRRRRAGKGFVYIGPDGRRIRDRSELDRIRAMAIPPAWTDVWISPVRNGHRLASGRDARGRKQYRYHPHWRKVRDETKYSRMVAFGTLLPRIRQRVEKDLALHGLPRRKILATVVRLLEVTLVRVGNEEYARTNRSYGLTTLRNGHVEFEGWTIRFRFRGKSGKIQEVGVRDRRLARIVRSCRDLPGYELFQYADETGELQTIDSADVNAYIRELSGQDFTAKDFRTWAGTVLAVLALTDLNSSKQAAARRRVNEAIKAVADVLGNTPAVCRKSYVHPAVIDAYLEGGLAMAPSTNRRRPSNATPAGLNAEEKFVLRLLEEQASKAAGTG